MTAVERSLLDAVLQNPADDLPRLVMADWYDENGDGERAEWIRFQISKPTRPRVPDWNCSCHIGKAPCGWCSHVKPKLLDEYVSSSAARGAFDRLANYKHGYELPGVKIEVSRGWPSAISCSLLSYLGGACERCTASSDDSWLREGVGYYSRADCPHCTDGHLPGLVESIGRRWPIVSVTLTDKRPHIDNESGMYEFARGNEFPSELPEELLAAMRRITGQTSGHLFFKEQESSQLALLDAAVSLMRVKAGLPAMRCLK